AHCTVCHPGLAGPRRPRGPITVEPRARDALSGRLGRLAAAGGLDPAPLPRVRQITADTSKAQGYNSAHPSKGGPMRTTWPLLAACAALFTLASSAALADETSLKQKAAYVGETI